MPVESESVWRALTSPHRRKLLDLLRDGPLTTGQLSRHLPELSRFAVMQHLGVLEEANLVVVRREGRHRFNYANAMPLREIYDRWVSSFSSTAAETTQHLRRYAESKFSEQAMIENMRVVKIELEVDIAAPPEVVFAALTENLDEWWPFRAKRDGRVVHEAKLGGTIREEWDGGGCLYGEITTYDAPHKCISVMSGVWGDAYSACNTDFVEPIAGGCRYRKSLRLWGEVSGELEDMFRQGTSTALKSALKSYCEEGKRYES